jgi:GxxExxY protein
LAYELKQLGMDIKQQVSMPFRYKELNPDIGYRIDLLVENKVWVEIKSIEQVAPVHFSQVLTYLRLSGLKLGLLINFISKILKDGIHRIANYCSGHNNVDSEHISFRLSEPVFSHQNVNYFVA